MNPNDIKKRGKTFSQSSQHRIAESVLNKVSLKNISENPDAPISRIFKYALDPAKIPVNDQKYSGRCWIFSFTNMLRRKMIKHYNLDPGFNFSHKYITFFDKLEKMNALFEVMYFYAQKDQTDSLDILHLRDSYMGDGGTWHYFVNIVNKYGIVPSEAYPENHSSNATDELNEILNQFVDSHITQVAATKTRASFEALKKKAMEKAINTLMAFLGVPPTELVWKYVDSKGKIHEPHQKPCSPLAFYERYVKPVVNVDDFVVLINDPRNPYHRLYSVELMHNVLPEHPEMSLDRYPTNRYLNVPSDVMRDVLLKSIRSNMPVPFAADVTLFMRSNGSRMDLDVRYDDLLGYSIVHPKKELYENHISAPNHAMLFIGANGPTGEWQVENSWGVANTKYPYLTMSDSWFEHYVGEIIVHKKYMTKALRDEYRALHKKADYTYLPFWDIFGTLAFSSS